MGCKASSTRGGGGRVIFGRAGKSRLDSYVSIAAAEDILNGEREDGEI